MKNVNELEIPGLVDLSAEEIRTTNGGNWLGDGVVTGAVTGFVYGGIGGGPVGALGGVLVGAAGGAAGAIFAKLMGFGGASMS
ncbi:MAG TPA: hypothetical protein VFF73_17280 [Planctomycetota bacterium]|nr:hypothetical protein [Planctomycetota bacterium]